MAAILTAAIALAATAPTAASQAKATSAAGPNVDLSGTNASVLLAIQELKTKCNTVLAATDSGDPNYTSLGTILADLV